MGKHRWHQPKAPSAGQAFHGSSPERDRQLADPGARQTIEPGQDGAAEISAQEHDQRLGVHGDREPADDFHLAAQHAGRSMSRPGPQEPPAPSEEDGVAAGGDRMPTDASGGGV